MKTTKTVEFISSKDRLIWIDWMKTLAMYLIIAGHCNVPGKEYIYTFSVPLFFILSGFLTKKETDVKLFWQKTLWNLIVPMFLFTGINLAYVYMQLIARDQFSLMLLWKGPMLALLGFQGQEYEGVGVGAMWFVYTLVLCKIIYQYIPLKCELSVKIIVSIIMLTATVVINECISYHINNNSYVNVLLAMPFFVIGNLLRPYKNLFTQLQFPRLFIILILGITGVLICGANNDIVYLYRCSYGNNLIICILGAISGTIAVYAFSRLLENFFVKIVSIIGGGTIVILGLHGNYFLHTISIITNRTIIGGWKYLECLIIMLVMIPIILLIKRFLPFLYGLKRV